MYHVIGPDGQTYPADMTSLMQWAQSGHITPESVVVDTATGRHLRAADLIPLHPIFAGRYPVAPPPPPVAPPKPPQPTAPPVVSLPVGTVAAVQFAPSVPTPADTRSAKQQAVSGVGIAFKLILKSFLFMAFFPITVPIWLLKQLFKPKPVPTCGMCGSFIGKNEKQIKWDMGNGATQIVCSPCSAAMRRKASTRAVKQKF